MYACRPAAGQPYHDANVQMQGSNLEYDGRVACCILQLHTEVAHHETTHIATPPGIFTFCVLSVYQPNVDRSQQGLFYDKDGKLTF